MRPLRDLQAAFAKGLLNRDQAGDVVGELAPDTVIAPADRLNIYRNTYIGTLVNALRVTYPAVDRLVGEAFFDAAAGKFAVAHPPRESYLNNYGAEFADFLAGFAPAASLPYLPDVARLEWALALAFNAPDAPVLDAGVLAALDPSAQGRVRFQPHPSTRLLRLAYDADLIQKAVTAKNEAAMRGMTPKPDPFWLIVHRLGNEVVMRRMNDLEAETTRALLDGMPLAEILAPETMDAQVAVLAEHLATGRFAGHALDP